MKKTLKISALLAVAVMICCAFGSCKSSKSSEGVMYNQKPRKGSQAIKSNYKVVGENVIEYSATDFEQPAI
ncbi:MAG: hypothetical protein J6W45_09945 [Bacteroidales bacterium]|nr:hypothetical protein [Bacteroidales bacterium]